MNTVTTRAALMAIALAGSPAAAEAGEQADYLKARPEVVEAWQDMRFGMFNCWGPVSLTGLEIGWSRGAPSWGRRPGMRGARGPTPAEVYDNLYKKWKPDRFDARAWVRVAKDAGMKYMIFLVKHHDGFCLYDSKLTDFKSTGAESAWKVDVMKEVADACHEADLKLIIYYSQPDWRHCDYLAESHDRYIKYLHGQVRELLTNYGRIDGLWFDNLRGRGYNAEAAELWDAEELFRMARSIQTGI
jgi:alpha-L-fucosidase